MNRREFFSILAAFAVPAGLQAWLPRKRINIEDSRVLVHGDVYMKPGDAIRRSIIEFTYGSRIIMPLVATAKCSAPEITGCMVWGEWTGNNIISFKPGSENVNIPARKGLWILRKWHVQDRDSRRGRNTIEGLLA